MILSTGMRHCDDPCSGLLYPAGSSSKPRSAKLSPGKISKGVGYGGEYSVFRGISSGHKENDTTRKASSEALKRQEEADASTTHLLTKIRCCLAMVHPPD